jgi:hypothetical protein
MTLDTPIASTATTEEERHSAGVRAAGIAEASGHRATNKVWEFTQASVATVVTCGVVAICGYMVVYGEPQLKLAAFLLLSQVFSQVVTEYFRRTNHTKSSGTDGHR